MEITFTDKDGIAYRGQWTQSPLNNCGMDSILGFNFQCVGVPLSTPKKDSWGIITNHKPVNRTETQMRAALVEALPIIVAKMVKPLIFMSDGLLREGYGGSLRTRHLIEALRAERCGVLTTSQIVNNPLYVEQSAIIGAFWTPPNMSTHLIHARPGWVGGVKERFIDRMSSDAKSLMEHVAAFRKRFYGKA